jgi:hypothetical protein
LYHKIHSDGSFENEKEFNDKLEKSRVNGIEKRNKYWDYKEEGLLLLDLKLLLMTIEGAHRGLRIIF